MKSTYWTEEKKSVTSLNTWQIQNGQKGGTCKAEISVKNARQITVANIAYTLPSVSLAQLGIFLQGQINVNESSC